MFKRGRPNNRFSISPPLCLRSVSDRQYLSGLTIGGKSLREHLEVVNHQQAIEYVETLVTAAEPITPFHDRQIHRLVLTRIDDDNAGQYRTLPVRIAGSAHQPPDAWAVPQLMDDWGNWLNGPL